MPARPCSRAAADQRTPGAGRTLHHNALAVPVTRSRLRRTRPTARCGPRPGKGPLPPTQCRSPLGRRPYNLRHAAVSLWLNSGVPATEVARCAGHGVAVLLKVYAHCIDGRANAANRRITTPSAPMTPNPTPPMRATARMSRHHKIAGQRARIGPDGQRNRFHRFVRGFSGPCPWLSRPQNSVPTDA